MKNARTMLVICGLLLAVSLVCVALVSSLPTQSADLYRWLQDSKMLLMIADEVLMFASIALLAAAVFLYQLFVPQNKIIATLGLAAWGVATIGCVTTVLAIGRLVYPVNEISVSTQLLEYSIAPVFSSLHLASIALGIGIIVFGLGLRKKSMIVVSSIIGLLQIIGTYFAKATPVWLLIVAAASLVVWVILVSFQLKKLDTKGTR